MEKAIATLKQRFTTPSADQMQQHPLCSICWADYDGRDQAVVLPCGHVFGEECVIAWASGVTPMGRHNGCPYCRAELLPPSMHSLTTALAALVSDVLALEQTLEQTLIVVSGGRCAVAFAVSLKTIQLAKPYLNLSPFWYIVLGLVSATHFVNAIRVLVKLQGWGWTRLSVAVALFGAMIRVYSYTSSSSWITLVL